jgi:drug/metabolite transporter (DMT)-like permease
MVWQWPSVILGLLAALSWGGSDFLGGLAGKRTSVVLVVVGAEVIGIGLMAAAALWWREPFPPLLECLWASLAGLVGLGAIFVLYTALSTEKMGVVAPIAGVVAAVVASALGVTVDGFPTGLQLSGFLLALLGIWLLSNPQVTGVTSRALLLSVASGICSGCFFFSIHQASPTSAFWPNFLERGVGLIVLAAVAAVMRPNLALKRIPWAQLVLLGVLDTSGALLFTLAARSGRLDVATVVSSLYPGGTIVLAWIGLKEPITRLQWVGIALALAAIALIAV